MVNAIFPVKASCFEATGVSSSCAADIHTTTLNTHRGRHHPRIRCKRKTESDDDDPADSGCLGIVSKKAEFTKISKLGFFAFSVHSRRCRSPPSF
jgi:hypothetical protein